MLHRGRLPVPLHGPELMAAADRPCAALESGDTRLQRHGLSWPAMVRRQPPSAFARTVSWTTTAPDSSASWSVLPSSARGGTWAPGTGSRPTGFSRWGSGARCARLRGHGRNVARPSDKITQSRWPHVLGSAAVGERAQPLVDGPPKRRWPVCPGRHVKRLKRPKGGRLSGSGGIHSGLGRRRGAVPPLAPGVGEERGGRPLADMIDPGPHSAWQT